MKHEWEPVDNLGNTMECARCGAHIYIESPDWDKEIDADCPGVDMIDIELKDGQSGYDVVGEYIRRYWRHNIIDTVIVSIGTSYDGDTYETRNEIASPYGVDDIEFLYDWWEGEKFIKILGIKMVSELDISGGIYTKG